MRYQYSLTTKYTQKGCLSERVPKSILCYYYFLSVCFYFFWLDKERNQGSGGGSTICRNVMCPISPILWQIVGRQPVLTKPGVTGLLIGGYGFPGRISTADRLVHYDVNGRGPSRDNYPSTSAAIYTHTHTMICEAICVSKEDRISLLLSIFFVIIAKDLFPYNRPSVYAVPILMSLLLFLDLAVRKVPPVEPTSNR